MYTTGISAIKTISTTSTYTVPITNNPTISTKPYSIVPIILFITTVIIVGIRLFGVCTKHASIGATIPINHICESVFMINFNFLTPTFKAGSLQFLKDQSYFFCDHYSLRNIFTCIATVYPEWKTLKTWTIVASTFCICLAVII